MSRYMNNYVWTQYDTEGNATDFGQLFARNQHHAKHLTGVYFQKQGKWVDRKKHSILEMNSSEYLILRQGYFE